MITRNTYKKLLWIDLESPTAEEVKEVMGEFSLDPMIADELLFPSLKPKVEIGGDYLYLVLHFPALKHSHKSGTAQEIDFIVGESFVITTHYDTIDPLHKFAKIFEVNSILDRSDIGTNAGYLFYYMLKKLYQSLDHELEYIYDALLTAEAGIFEGQEKQMVRKLSLVSRDLLNMRQALVGHADILRSLEQSAPEIFGKSITKRIRDISTEYYRIENTMKSHSALLLELRETNNSLVSTKQNEVMKTFTIMAFTTLPLSLIAAVFGMNTQYTPVSGHPFDFWIIVAMMVVTALAFFGYFRHKGWL